MVAKRLLADQGSQGIKKAKVGEDHNNGTEAEGEELMGTVMLLKRPAAATEPVEQSESEPMGAVMLLKRPAAATEPVEQSESEPELDVAPKIMKKPAAAKLSQINENQPNDPCKEAELEEKEPKKTLTSKPFNKSQDMISVIHRIIQSIPFKEPAAPGVVLHPGALTSFDEEGYPSTRTVIPDYISDDLSEIRVNSKEGSRKQTELSNNSKVSVHFQDLRGRGGWVTIKGLAKLKASRTNGYFTIVIVPERIEVMSYNEGVMADADGWKPAIMVRHMNDFWRRTK